MPFSRLVYFQAVISCTSLFSSGVSRYLSSPVLNPTLINFYASFRLVYITVFRLVYPTTSRLVFESIFRLNINDLNRILIDENETTRLTRELI